MCIYLSKISPSENLCERQISYIDNLSSKKLQLGRLNKSRIVNKLSYFYYIGKFYMKISYKKIIEGEYCGVRIL